MMPPSARPRSARRPAGRVRRAASVSYRSASIADAEALHTLITSDAGEGHLLPRALEELEVHAARFVVAVRRGRIVGCAELAPLSGAVAEIRSLVVVPGARGFGIGRELVSELHRRARRDGFGKLCAFTHDAGYFVRQGFSIVPHAWLPEKIALDCRGCAKFLRCGQHAVQLTLDSSLQARPGHFVPLAAVRG